MKYLLYVLIFLFPVLFAGTASTENTFTIGTVEFGRFDQDNDLSNGDEPIEWYVLDDENGLFLLSKEILYGGTPDSIYTDQRKWNENEIREWLNGEFYTKAFDSSEKNAIKKTKLSTNGADTEDYVFLLDEDEVNQYLKSTQLRKAGVTKTASHKIGVRDIYEYEEANGLKNFWWLRSSTYKGNQFVDPFGKIKSLVPAGNRFGIRPAIVLDIKKETSDTQTEERNSFDDGRILAGQYQYTILDDGTAMLVGVESNEESISIPDSIDGREITRISRDAFQACENVKSIILPKPLATLEDNPFIYCRQLEKITFGQEAKKKNKYFVFQGGVLYSNTEKTAIFGARQIESAEILYGVRKIGDSAFSHCTELKEVIIPETVASIGENAFEYSGLTQISLGKGIEDVGRNAFSHCEQLLSADLYYSSLKMLRENTFSFCKNLHQVEMPKSLVEIGANCFAECTGLTKVSLRKEIRKIDEGAFFNNVALNELDLPDNVDYIGENAFSKTVCIVTKNSPAEQECIRKNISYRNNAKEYAADPDIIDIQHSNALKITKVASVGMHKYGNVYELDNGIYASVLKSELSDDRKVITVTLAIENKSVNPVIVGLSGVISETGIVEKLTYDRTMLCQDEIGYLQFQLRMDPDFENTYIGYWKTFFNYTLNSGVILEPAKRFESEDFSALVVLEKRFANSEGVKIPLYMGYSLSEATKNAELIDSGVTQQTVEMSTLDISSAIVGGMGSCMDGKIDVYFEDAALNSSKDTVYLKLYSENISAYYMNISNILINGVHAEAENSSILVDNKRVTNIKCRLEHPIEKIEEIEFDFSTRLEHASAEESPFSNDHVVVIYPHKAGRSRLILLKNPSQKLIERTKEARETTLLKKRNSLLNEVVLSNDCFIFNDGFFRYKPDMKGYEIVANESKADEYELPDVINGKPVVRIGANVFHFLSRISIGDHVTEIADSAFKNSPYATIICNYLGDGRENISNWIREHHLFYEQRKGPFIKDGIHLNLLDDGTLIYEGSDTPKAEETVKSEYCGFSVSGIGTIVSNQMTKKYTISEGIQNIGENAFSNCTEVETVVLPDSIISFGESCFRGCEKLRNVVLPGKVTEIPDKMFSGCKSLEKMIIPENVTIIGNDAFRYCSALKEISIPESVETIGRAAFSDTGLQKAYIYNKDCSFYGGDTYTTSFPGTTELFCVNGGAAMANAVGRQARPRRMLTNDVPYSDYVYYISGEEVCIVGYEGKDTSFDIPEKIEDKNVGSIYHDAFRGCSVNKVVIPETVHSIGDNAFAGTGLTEVKLLSKHRMYLGQGAFSENTTIYCYEEVAKYLDTRKYRYIMILASPTQSSDQSKEYEYTIENNEVIINNIKNRQTSVIIPSEVDGLAVRGIGDSFLENDDMVEEISLPEGVRTIGNNFMSKSKKLKKCNLPDTLLQIGDNFLMGNQSLFSITLPSSLVSIGAGFLAETVNLQTCIIPESVVEIGEGPFASAESIALIRLSRKYSAFDNFDFLYHRTFHHVFIVADSAGMINTTKNKYVHYCTIKEETGGCQILEDDSHNVYFYVENGNISFMYLQNADKTLKLLFANCAEETEEIVIPEKVLSFPVISIGEYAFSRAQNTTRIILSEGITTLEKYAFKAVSHKEIQLPKTITHVSEDAFNHSNSNSFVLERNSYLDKIIPKYLHVNIPPSERISYFNE